MKNGGAVGLSQALWLRARGAKSDEASAQCERGRRAPSASSIAVTAAEAAEALRPRLHAWIGADVLPDALALRAMARVLKPTAKCAPAFCTAVLRTWCRAWSSTFRRGLGSAPCPACMRPGADRIEHLVRCAKL